MTSWFSWFDQGPEEDAVVAAVDPDKAGPWRVGLENPSLKEPLEDIEEATSGAESASVSSAAREKRRTVREIRSYVSQGIQERQEKMVRSQSSEDYVNPREAYRVADEDLSDSQGTEIELLNSFGPTENVMSLTESAEDDNEADSIDLQIVEEYDHAFNEFIASHPQFVMISPDVVHSLRVCKLQKLLERGSSIQAELQDELKYIEKQKDRMEIAYQRELKDASRKKAARQVHLASKLAVVQKATTAMETKLTWKLVSTFEANAKKQHRKREQLRSTPVEHTCRGLLKVLPKGSDFQSIRDAMMVPPSSEPLSQTQQEDIQQFQIDNAFLHSEVAVLQKKLKHVKAAARKHAWVESMLVRMDPKVLQTIKQRYAKNKGVASL